MHNISNTKCFKHFVELKFLLSAGPGLKAVFVATGTWAGRSGETLEKTQVQSR